MEEGFRLEEAIRTFFADKDVELVYLFGSRAAGRNTEDSDVDVAVLLQYPPHRASSLSEAEARLQLRLDWSGELGRILGLPVDLILLDDAPPLLAMEVIDGGRVLWERPGTPRISYEVQVASCYMDTAPLRHFFNKAYIPGSQPEADILAGGNCS